MKVLIAAVFIALVLAASFVVAVSVFTKDHRIAAHQPLGENYKIYGPSHRPFDPLDPWHDTWSRCDSDDQCEIIYGPNCGSYEVANEAYLNQVQEFQRTHRFCTSSDGPGLPSGSLATCVNNTCVLAIPKQGIK